MKSLDYHIQIQTLVENALLNLYCFVSNYKQTKNVKFVKNEIRNKAITDFLKSQQKMPCYNLIKKDIKVLINAKKLGSIEKKLIDLYKPNIKKETDVEKFLGLVNSFEGSCFSVELIDEKPEQKNDTLFILKEHIEYCFDEHDNQIEPVSFLIKTKLIEKFENILNLQEYFKYKLVQSNNENFNYHYFIYSDAIANKV